MAITIGSVLLMCVALIGLYNKLAPRPIGGEMKAANSVTGNIDIEQEESVGMDISPTLLCPNLMVLFQSLSLEVNP